MFGRMLGAIVVAACFAARADAAPPAPTLDAIAAAARAAQSSHCSTDECGAVVTVNRVMNILLDAQSTAQGVTTPMPGNRDDAAAKRLRAVLLAHPQKFSGVCHELTGIVAQYPPGDLFVAVSVIEIALRMDLVSGNCLPGVLAAFPASGKATIALENAQILCANAWGVDTNNCERIKFKTGR